MRKIKNQSFYQLKIFFHSEKLFDLPRVNAEDIDKLIKSLNIKVYERIICNNLTMYAVTFLLNFISAYCASYSSNHVLMRSLDQNKFAGALAYPKRSTVHITISDLLTAKLHAYRFSHDCFTFFYSYLKYEKTKF